MRAFVTGGGRGIGAGIARALAGRGWDVVVGARGRGEVEAVAHEVGGESVQLDVSDASSVERAFGRVGEIDLLVANAGIRHSREQERRPSWELDPRDWWHVHEVNVLGVHLCCRAAIPGMLERGRCRIVITASAAAYVPGGDRTAYPSSKAAVCRYGETLANELAGAHPGLPLQSGPGAHQDDGGCLPGRRSLDAAGPRAEARRQARLGPLRPLSPDATCTRRTTTSTISWRASTRCASAI